MDKILTDSDLKFLKSIGHLEEDFNQLEDAANECKYELWKKDYPSKERSRKQIIKILGRKKWLTGLSRAAFHATAVREKGNIQVYFNLNEWWK